MKKYLLKKYARIKKVLGICRIFIGRRIDILKTSENEFHVSFICLSYIRAAGSGFACFVGPSQVQHFNAARRFFCAFFCPYTSLLFSHKNCDK